MGKEVYAQKTDFIRLFWEKVVSDVSRWAWHTREQVINRKKPIFLKLALPDTGRKNQSCLKHQSSAVSTEKKRFFYETGVDNMHSIAYN